MGCHACLQGFFLTQGLNLRLLHLLALAGWFFSTTWGAFFIHGEGPNPGWARSLKLRAIPRRMHFEPQHLGFPAAGVDGSGPECAVMCHIRWNSGVHGFRLTFFTGKEPVMWPWESHVLFGNQSFPKITWNSWSEITSTSSTPWAEAVREGFVEEEWPELDLKDDQGLAKESKEERMKNQPGFCAGNPSKANFLPQNWPQPSLVPRF